MQKSLFRSIVLNLLRLDMTTEVVAKTTGLTEEGEKIAK